MRVLAPFAVLAAVLAVPHVHIHAQDSAPAPEVWMMPPGHENGRAFRELFEQPEAWQETRARIDVLGYADHNLNRQFTDDELRPWLEQLNEWNVRLGLEVGAIKPWGLTAEKTFQVERPIWERIERLGGRIYAVAMDEPLLCCRHHIKKSDEYALQETAEFIALVRRHFPHLLVGDIETYPSIPLADHLWWIDALNDRLAKMNVRGLDFYRLDVNWVVFTAHSQGSWREVKSLELQCRKRGLPFSLIYWASGLPAAERKGLADDSTWYVGIMQQGYDYALADGAPDHYVIESWVGAPSCCVPETDPWTFTRSVLDFAKKFVPQDK